MEVVLAFILLIQDEIVAGTVLDGMLFELRSESRESQSLLVIVLVTSFTFEGLPMLSTHDDLPNKFLDDNSEVEITTGLAVLIAVVFTLLGDRLCMSGFPIDFGEELKFTQSFDGVEFLTVGDAETVLVTVVTGEVLVSFTTDAVFEVEEHGVKVRTFL